jgi:zinc transport system substrate-binding protein
MKIRFVLMLLGCCLSVRVVADSEKIPVFVSIPPQKQFVEKIGGNLVQVEVLLPPGESPETFSPSPKMLVSLSKAKLYFQIGVPFEKNLLGSIQSLNHDIKIIMCCDHIIKVHQHLPDEHGHYDLHIWSSPINVMKIAHDIKEALSLIDPANAEEYSGNYFSYIAELTTLDRDIKQRLAERRTNYFIVSHAAWGDFADQYGLQQIAMEKNNRESGPKSLLNIIRLAHSENINTLFVQEQYKTPSVYSLARELSASIVELDPLAEDYLTNMVRISARIADALR